MFKRLCRPGLSANKNNTFYIMAQLLYCLEFLRDEKKLSS